MGMRPALLDISRTISRIGRGPATGIDRVEAAYMRWAEGRAGSAFLTRMGRKVALIDARAMPALRQDLEQTDAARNWPLHALLPGRNPRDKRAERAVARHASSVALPENIGPALSKHFAGPFTYLNVGHTHLEDRRLSALRSAGAEQMVVMIHDVIPLDFAKTQTKRSVESFRRRFAAATTRATHLLTSAQATAQTIRARLPQGAPALHVLPLALDPPPQVPAHKQDRPYFVQLGTVEPRKNTAFLLDIWERLPQPRPELMLIGAKGWLSDRLFDRIASMPQDVTHLTEMSDAQVIARLKGARALLFPSLSEGYGFPLLEALQLNVPVIANDLTIFREIGEKSPLYLSVRDGTSWSQEITERASRGHAWRAEGQQTGKKIPRWSEYFDHLEYLLFR